MKTLAAFQTADKKHRKRAVSFNRNLRIHVRNIYAKRDNGCFFRWNSEFRHNHSGIGIRRRNYQITLHNHRALKAKKEIQVQIDFFLIDLLVF